MPVTTAYVLTEPYSVCSTFENTTTVSETHKPRSKHGAGCGGGHKSKTTTTSAVTSYPDFLCPSLFSRLCRSVRLRFHVQRLRATAVRRRRAVQYTCSGLATAGLFCTPYVLSNYNAHCRFLSYVILLTGHYLHASPARFSNCLPFSFSSL